MIGIIIDEFFFLVGPTPFPSSTPLHSFLLFLWQRKAPGTPSARERACFFFLDFFSFYCFIFFFFLRRSCFIYASPSLVFPFQHFFSALALNVDSLLFFSFLFFLLFALFLFCITPLARLYEIIFHVIYCYYLLHTQYQCSGNWSRHVYHSYYYYYYCLRPLLVFFFLIKRVRFFSERKSSIFT